MTAFVKPRVTILFLTCVVAHGIACSSGDDTAPASSNDSASDGSGEVDWADGSPNDSEVAPDADGPAGVACAALAAARCKNHDKCNPSLIATQFGTVAQCAERRKIACLGALAAPGSGVTVAGIEACAVGVAAENCFASAHGPHPKECAQTGSFDEGTACGFGGQCKSGNCLLAGGTDCKTCGKPFLAVGASCSGFECEPGLYCASNKCVLATDTGAACSTDKPCWIGAVCIGGKCVPHASKGEPCETLGCELGMVCDAATKKCVDPPPLAKPGEACGPPNCSAAGSCLRKDDAGTAGTCVARAADGAACDPAAGIGCFPASACTGGKCTPFDASMCK